MDIGKIKERMVEINEEIAKLEAKRAAGTEAEQDVFQGLIEDRNAEFLGLEGKAASIKEAERKAKALADLDSGRDEVEAKSAKMVDVSDSQHNSDMKDIEDTRVFTGYFGAQGVSKYMTELCSKKGDLYVENRMGKDGGMLLPKWMANGVLPKTASSTYERAIENIVEGKAAVLVRNASGTGSGGGSLVEEMFDANLFKIPNRGDSIPEMCYVKRAVGKEVQFPKLSQGTNEYGVAVKWGNAGANAGEGVALSESSPVFSRTDVNLERIGLYSQASLREVRENQVGLEAELMWMYRGAYNRALTKAILQGVISSGTALTAAPQGINTNVSIAAGVNVVTRTTANQVNYTDMVNLQFAVADGVFGEGVFVISGGSTGAMKYIAALKDSSGRPVFAQEDTWQHARGSQVAGSSVIATVGNAQALGARGDVMFLNLNSYGLAVSGDVAVERSDEFAFDTGLVTYRMITYAGGALLGHDMNAVLGDVSGASSSSSS